MPALTIEVDKPGAAINPHMWGVFFEDINFAADGGLYPQRVKNGSFEFDDRIMGWRKTERGEVVGGLGVISEDPLNPNNPHFLRITVENPGEGFGVTNEGFRGIGVREGEKFTFSVFVRVRSSKTPMALAIELQDPRGRVIGSGKLSGFAAQWKKHACEIVASATEPNARLVVLASGKGVIDLDMVSLFPSETFRSRPNGLRKDIAQLLSDLKPGFIRFPGGCIVEGRVLEHRYQWKTTIGELQERRLIMNRWNVEFGPPRNAPDYHQSFGIGFFEYFQFCEDIGAEPLPILNCGMACQYNFGELVPLDQLGPYIQDALDLIEFANGPASSTWGAKRAAMGHPESFHLKMIGIGNEQWGPQYFERYEHFAKALKERHPEITLISSSGPQPDGREFDYAWGRLRQIKAELVDEHYYRDPGWFLRNVNRYDSYDRKGPKVFAGEYAAHTQARRNNLEAALAEAAFMTGLERNADVVRLASYAPLLAHVEAWQWAPNLIWFDNLRCFGTPSYYVQKLFSHHRGDAALPARLEQGPDGVFASAALDRAAGQVIVKVVNTTAAAVQARIQLSGAGKIDPRAVAHVLTAANPNDENTLEFPARVAPMEQAIDIAAAEFEHEYPAHSLTVLRITAAAR